MTMGSMTPYGMQTSPLHARSTTSNASPEGQGNFAFLAVLMRRWRVFLAVALGFALFVGVATFLTPKTYTTTVRMMMGNPSVGNVDNSGTNLPILNALVLQSGVQSAETFATLAQQESVAAAVKTNLHVPGSPGALLSHVTVFPTSNTAILNLSVDWRDPGDSAKIANAFADAFIVKERDFERSQALTAIRFLKSELPNARANMQSAASQLARFQASNGFVDATSHTQEVVSKATAMETKIDNLALDSREAAALLENASDQLAALPATINNSRQITVNPVLTDLQTKLEQVNLQLSQARAQYTDQHPLVLSLRKQRDALVAQIAQAPPQVDSANTLTVNPVYQSLQQQIVQYRQRIDGDNADLSLLRRQRAAMSPLLSKLPEQSMRLSSLQQQAKLASDVYNALESKYNDATIVATTAISDISIVQPATADSAAVRPNIRINLLAALVVGLFLACITVFTLEILERALREPAVPNMFGLPVISRIPLFTTSNRRMLPWLQSMTVEAFLQLCVALKLKNKSPMRTLAVTSASRDDGKSTIAFNLAKAMSELEPRVLLIDADLRRPVLHKLASTANTVGLSDVLQSETTIGEAVQALSRSLDLLAAGPSVANPVSLIKSSTFEDVISEATQAYDMVIVDTPALCSVTDGYVVSSKTDATVLVISVASNEQSQAREVVATFAALGINNLLGIVLNRDRKRVSDYSDYFAQQERGTALPGGSA